MEGNKIGQDKTCDYCKVSLQKKLTVPGWKASQTVHEKQMKCIYKLKCFHVYYGLIWPGGNY